MNYDNWKIDTTIYELQEYQINDPNLYDRVQLDDLKVGNAYRYCNFKGTIPYPIQILSNDNDNLIITNPFSILQMDSLVIKKSKVKPDTEFFYTKNYYSCRSNYLKLKEGLKLPEGKSLDPVCRYLFDDENIIKEIASFQNTLYKY
jgi:hypothetical protein